jgi:type IV secretory pathway VirB2 component (pilin)
MELPVAKGVSSAGMIAVGTATFFADAGTLFERRLWQVMGIDNTFGGVGNVLTGTGHSGFFLE